MIKGRYLNTSTINLAMKLMILCFRNEFLFSIRNGNFQNIVKKKILNIANQILLGQNLKPPKTNISIK